ncbi:LysR family transcriptional regulator [Actinospica durhamensis]|uniref:LysR family transcriptional regulator n=1 Tax=Actinospica durhamensis TaxID=1508375 RepID=A0A941IQ62_9ACTN|nr:LysR family transcriptional regulator [Actinospica durhamensis]MBR7837300.1 LysR family transcriptional regulator [Actinospica durhamensis]
MDLVGACRVFVSVAERGSFTLGAAAERIPQSVASRRVAALEKHFGQPLFDRTARRAVLTVFGQDLLGPAKRLVQYAEALDHHAAEAKLRPLTLAVPETCDVRRLAMLDAAARDADVALDLRCAGPEQRAAWFASKEVRAAVRAVPPAEATWVVPLGLAAARAVGSRAGGARLESLRPSRTEPTFRRVWIQPEDDVPYVRDVLQRAGHRAALLPAQISVANSLIAAVGAALRTGDFVLASADQARELGLAWRPIADASLARGYTVAAHVGETTADDTAETSPAHA